MFEVRIMVEDKNVPKVLWALDGLVVGMPQTLPVRAAEAKNGKVVSTQPVPGGSLVQQTAYKLSQWSAPTIEWVDFTALMYSVGAAQTSRGYIVSSLREMKAIKHVGGGHRKPIYKILKQNTEV